MAAAAETSPDARPDFAVLVYPASSWGSIDAFGPGTPPRDTLLGAEPTRAQRDAISVELIATADTPPVLTIHAADDFVIPVRHSLLLTETLSRLRVPVELHVLPHGGHGFGLGTENPEIHRWTALCADWLGRYA